MESKLKVVGGPEIMFLTACSLDDHIILLYFTQKLLYKIKDDKICSTEFVLFPSLN
jgi:hypothetical protein